MLEQLYAKTEYVKQTVSPPDAPRSEREAFELAKEKKMRHIWERLNKIASEDEKRSVLRAEWERTDEELKAKLEAAKRESEIREQQRQRDEERRTALAEERRRLQAVEEAARRVREERNAKAKAMAEELAAELKKEQNEAHQDNLLDDKRRLLKMMFRLQYSPDPADVGDMTDIEVFILSELMEDISKKMKGVYEARMNKGPCSRCKVEPKVTQCMGLFQCTHACLCKECSQRASQCPLCGAKRLQTVKRSQASSSGAGQPSTSSDTTTSSSSTTTPRPAGATSDSTVFPRAPPTTAAKNVAPASSTAGEKPAEQVPLSAKKVSLWGEKSFTLEILFLFVTLVSVIIISIDAVGKFCFL